MGDYSLSESVLSILTNNRQHRIETTVQDDLLTLKLLLYLSLPSRFERHDESTETNETISHLSSPNVT